MAMTQGVEVLHIKMNDFIIPAEKILKEGYNVALENTYAQAKRTNTLQMVKILIGKVYTLSVTLHNITTDEMKQIQKIALQPEINVEFYDDSYAEDYVTQNMYCTTVTRNAIREFKDGKILYKDFTLKFRGNQKVDF